MELHIAPLQGFTGAAWRHFRHAVYGDAHPEYTPFVRYERGEVRDRDLRDYTSPLNSGADLIPQVIFKDVAELAAITDTLVSAGATRIDMNCGCPFPPQTRRGRGAAVIARPALLSEVSHFISSRPEIRFSLKMRLGMELPDEWRNIIDIINGMPLRHITVHPRVARQQYAGELHQEEFGKLLERSVHPVIYNGELHTPEDIEAIAARFPDIKGVMVGRGLCARPSLLAEYACGKEWTAEMRISYFLDFHDRLLDYYEKTLCGPVQILQNIKPFWTYAEGLIGHRTFKLIAKAGSLASYKGVMERIAQTAV